MRLFIGKNHQIDPSPVRSIFRLAGKDEDALTFALGYLLAHDDAFCDQVLRTFRISSTKVLSAGYSVHLQEITTPTYGRRDVVIQADDVRVVFEAKVGGAEPTPGQLLKYAGELELWKKTHKTRAVVALTQVELAASTTDKVTAELAKSGISFHRIQWHEIIDLIVRHTPSGDAENLKHLFDEFVRYVRSDYDMGYYDAEILIQDVNLRNAGIYDDCWMYVTSSKDKKAPLYFAPYFTLGNERPGLSMISRVVDVENTRLIDKQVEDVPGSGDPADEHVTRWRCGIARLRERAKEEGFFDLDVRLLYLDRPVTFSHTPLTKKTYTATDSSKKIPNQIPKGFSLIFDELLTAAIKKSGEKVIE